MLTKRQREAICAHYSATSVRETRDGMLYYSLRGTESHGLGFDYRRAGTVAEVLALLGDTSCEVVAVATGRRITQELYHSVAQADQEAQRLNAILGGPLCIGRRIGAAEGSI